MTAAEHLQFAKDRALRYVEQGDILNAFTSMGSDLAKHPELANHPGIDIMFSLLLIEPNTGRSDARRIIEGFR